MSDIAGITSVDQQPGDYNLSAMVPDFVMTATADVIFELLQGTNSILTETYSPDSDGKIYIRELWKVFECYVSASLDETEHNTIALPFTIKLNNTVFQTFQVLKCQAYMDIAASDLFAGNAFLNLMKRVKTTTRTSKEYITCHLMGTITAFVTSLVNGVPVNSAEVILDDSDSGKWKTLDVSFSVIAALFPAINPVTILALRIKTTNQIQVLMIDSANYLAPLNFMFKNSFDAPETIVTRGNVIRKGVETFESGKMAGIELKFNIQRADTFEVSSGKIFSLNDYDRYREMFNSEDVRVYYVGKWCKVIIAEEDASQNIKSGTLTPITFTFRFADTFDNRFITGEAFMRWILEYGKWEDDKVWIDQGQWNDSIIPNFNWSWTDPVCELISYVLSNSYDWGDPVCELVNVTNSLTDNLLTIHNDSNVITVTSQYPVTSTIQILTKYKTADDISYEQWGVQIISGNSLSNQYIITGTISLVEIIEVAVGIDLTIFDGNYSSSDDTYNYTF